MSGNSKLSRREREIMDVVFALGEASANQILERLSDAPSNTAVRTHLRILEEKGVLTHKQVGKRFVYRAKQSKKRVGRTALERVLRVYFGDSLEEAVAAHFSDPKAKVSDEELDALDELIKSARKNKGKSK